MKLLKINGKTIELPADLTFTFEVPPQVTIDPIAAQMNMIHAQHRRLEQELIEEVKDLSSRTPMSYTDTLRLLIAYTKHLGGETDE